MLQLHDFACGNGFEPVGREFESLRAHQITRSESSLHPLCVSAHAQHGGLQGYMTWGMSDRAIGNLWILREDRSTKRQTSTTAGPDMSLPRSGASSTGIRRFTAWFNASSARAVQSAKRAAWSDSMENGRGSKNKAIQSHSETSRAPYKSASAHSSLV
jgi:hypothetical protein